VNERPVLTPLSVLAVAVGGALGAPARYELARVVHPSAGFPLPTLAVNISGAFVLGLLVAAVSDRTPGGLHARQFFGAGVLGAYTTYSTFAVETDLLLRHARIGVAVGYVAATLIGGLAAAFLGRAFLRRVQRTA
jgi:CrcB protein